MGAGGHIVASRALYGGSHNLLAYTLARFGIETTFVNPRDLEDWRRGAATEHAPAVRRDARQPGARRAGHPAVSTIAHEHGVPLLVDSTFTTPWLMTPFDHGADLVYHSATKFLGGHGVAIARAGRRRHLRLAGQREISNDHGALCRLSRHELREESTVAPFLLRARREGLRDFGACMSAHTAFLLLQGIETLPLRMARHVENARAVVKF